MKNRYLKSNFDLISMLIHLDLRFIVISLCHILKNTFVFSEAKNIFTFVCFRYTRQFKLSPMTSIKRNKTHKSIIYSVTNANIKGKFSYYVTE